MRFCGRFPGASEAEDKGAVKVAGKKPKNVREPTPADRAAFSKKFAGDHKAQGVSLKRDDDGVFVHTHRARSHSYASADKIPKKVVAFIDSTG